jgi:hypothetical protein
MILVAHGHHGADRHFARHQAEARLLERGHA